MNKRTHTHTHTHTHSHSHSHTHTHTRTHLDIFLSDLEEEEKGVEEEEEEKEEEGCLPQLQLRVRKIVLFTARHDDGTESVLALVRGSVMCYKKKCEGVRGITGSTVLVNKVRYRISFTMQYDVV